jgi:hypothetical protein
MFLIEGGLSFDTRNAVAGAQAFQRELVNTSKVAQQTSRAGADLESSFSNPRSREALRGLQASLMQVKDETGAASSAGANLEKSFSNEKARSSLHRLENSLKNTKDATEAAEAGANALSRTLVHSLGGTAAIVGAKILYDSFKEVGKELINVANESSKVTSGIVGMAQSLEEGSKRADILTQSADNTLKKLEELNSETSLKGLIFSLSGGAKVMQDLEDATRGLAKAEYGAGAQAGRITAERRVGMSPEEIAADKRKEEEKQRLREAETKGGAGARADVARTIQAENRTSDIQKNAEERKSFEKDMADYQSGVAQRQAEEEKRINKERIDGLNPAQKIIELDKEAVSISEKKAAILKMGIYGTEELRKKQLEELNRLDEQSLQINQEKSKALEEQKQATIAAKKAAQEEADKKAEIQADEENRARRLKQSIEQAHTEMGRIAESQRQSNLESQLAKFFGASAWSSVPENIRQQMVNGGVSAQHLAAINRNTAKPVSSGYGYQENGRFGRRSSGIGSLRPPGYVSDSGLGMRDVDTQDRVPYKRTSVRGYGPPPQDNSFTMTALTSAINNLAKKIPASVPV